jgi:hypothetical protein
MVPGLEVVKLSRQGETKECFPFPFPKKERLIADFVCQDARLVFLSESEGPKRQKIPAPALAFNPVKGTRQKIGGSRFQRPVSNIFVVDNRHHDDRDIFGSIECAEAPEKFDAIDAGHFVVDENQVGNCVYQGSKG